MSQRIVLALDLVDDAALIETYEARHAPGAVWPEVVSELYERGMLDMEIWRVADRLVMIADVADDYPRATAPALAPFVERWESEMDVYQRRLDPAGPKWTPLARVFALSEQNGIAASD